MGKKGVMSLSKTLQLMLHAVLFTCAKWYPVLFCWSLFSILHSKLHISSCRQTFPWSRNTSQKQLPEVLIIKLLKQRDHWLKDTRAPFIAIRTSVREALLSNRHRKPLNQMWLYNVFVLVINAHGLSDLLSKQLHCKTNSPWIGYHQKVAWLCAYFSKHIWLASTHFYSHPERREAL